MRENLQKQRGTKRNPRRLRTQRDTLTYKRGKERETKAEIFLISAMETQRNKRKDKDPETNRDKEERKLKSRN